MENQTSGILGKKSFGVFSLGLNISGCGFQMHVLIDMLSLIFVFFLFRFLRELAGVDPLKKCSRAQVIHCNQVNFLNLHIYRHIGPGNVVTVG